MAYRTDEAEAAFDELSKLITSLRAAEVIASGADDILSDNDLAASNSTSAVDVVADALGAIEALRDALASEIGLRAAA